MTYTILSAKYANPEHSAAVLRTKEAGDVAVSKADSPGIWAAVTAGDVAAYVPPPEATPTEKVEAALGMPLSEIKALLAGG